MYIISLIRCIILYKYKYYSVHLVLSGMLLKFWTYMYFKLMTRVIMLSLSS